MDDLSDVKNLDTVIAFRGTTDLSPSWGHTQPVTSTIESKLQAQLEDTSLDQIDRSIKRSLEIRVSTKILDLTAELDPHARFLWTNSCRNTRQPITIMLGHSHLVLVVGVISISDLFWVVKIVKKCIETDERQDIPRPTNDICYGRGKTHVFGGLSTSWAILCLSWPKKLVFDKNESATLWTISCLRYKTNEQNLKINRHSSDIG